MRIEPLFLTNGVDGKRAVRWREICGADELKLFGCDFAGAIEWLAGAVTGGEGCVAASDVPELTLADGDRLFEAVYRAFFGNKAEFRQRCASCGDGFEISLLLDGLFAGRDAACAGQSEDLSLLAGGSQVRALRLGDIAAADGNESALLGRALIRRGSDGDEDIAAAVERLSPSRIETIETRCPHCEVGQAFAFDLTAFLLRCTARERPVLLREIHCLARGYGWSLAEIVALDRGARHELVRLVAASAAPRVRARAA